MRKLGRRGQAMTEVVLLFPIFMFFLFAFAKVFALLVLMQKLEIASFYAARRWQLESHRSAKWEQEFDGPALLPHINKTVLTYLGYETPAAKFLDLVYSCRQTSNCPSQPGVTVQRTQVWNVVTVTACTRPLEMPFYKTTGFVVCSTKYVPNRDRPIAFVLPGISQ
ncbi:MAG: pilus assembly protein [Elusimicrobia bacterium]|nr:pilus assembly protein [Elusimicrobiota bacterium]